MRFSIFQPAYVCLPLSLPCLSFCVCVSIDCLRRTMRLLALGCSCRRRTLTHRQPHIATPSKHTHTETDRHTQPCGWIACCTSIFEFCCFIISWRIACNLSLPLPLSVSLYDWFLGFYVLGIGIIIIISRLAALGNLWPLALENIGFSFSLLLFPHLPAHYQIQFLVVWLP